MLSSTASGGGNLLLKLAPDQYGAFRPSEIAIIKGMGKWLEKYGEAVYVTRGGSFSNGDWGGSTHRGNTVYLHVFEWDDNKLNLGPLPQKITGACVLPDQSDVNYYQSSEKVEVVISPDQKASPVTVIKLILDQPVPEGLAVEGVAGFHPDN